MNSFYLPFFVVFFFVFSDTAYSQGDLCTSAVLIAAGTHQADGPDSGDGCHNCSPGNAGGIPAVHADWYKFSPTADGVINISTCLQGADTRLWIYSGSCGNLTQVGASDDACDFVQGEPFAAAIENLSVLSGTDYFIEFDDAWDRTGFEFTLDFFAVTNNIFVSKNALCFTQIPVNQLVNSNIPIEVIIGKQGSVDQNALTVSSDIFNADSPSSPVASFNQMNISLSGNGNKTITTGMLPALPVGKYYIQSIIGSPMPDDDNSDNTIISPTFEVTDRTFAIDDGDFPGGLGISGPGSIQMGQIMHFPKGDKISSVSFNIQGGTAGDSVRALIYDFDAMGPINLLYESKFITTGTTDPQWFEIPFDTPFSVSDDSKYLVALQHLATGVGIDLAVSNEIFKPMNGYIKVLDEPWLALESNNQNGNPFQFAYAIRPNNQPIFTKVKLKVDMRDEDSSAGNVAIKYLLNDEPAQTTAMTDLGNGIWEGEFEVPLFADVRYLFVNNDSDELVPDDCGEAIRGVVYRTLSVRFDELDLPPVCFSRCGICPIQGCVDPDFIICDDFEAYDSGTVTPQSLFWIDWNGTNLGGLITDERAFDGSQSIKFTKTDPPIDALLLLNDNTTGRYELTWKQYVPSGKSAVFNFQHQIVPEHFWGRNFFFDPGGAGEVWLEEKEVDFNFAHDEWLDIQFIIDLDNDYAKFLLNGAEVYSWRYSEVTDYEGAPDPDLNQLSAINFTASEDSDEWYVDNVFFSELISLPGNVCFGAIDVSQYLGSTTPELRFIDHTNESIDPEEGWECFPLDSLRNTLWVSFVGDGKPYLIESVDTQGQVITDMALYKGDCNDLIPLECEENGGIILMAEQDSTYFLLLETRVVNPKPTIRVTFSPVVTTNNQYLENAIRLYPNPANDFLNIESKNQQVENFQISIFDYLGTLKHQEAALANPKRIDTSDWQSGVYLIRIQQGDAVTTRKVIIQ